MANAAAGNGPAALGIRARHFNWRRVGLDADGHRRRVQTITLRINLRTLLQLLVFVVVFWQVRRRLPSAVHAVRAVRAAYTSYG